MKKTLIILIVSLMAVGSFFCERSNLTETELRDIITGEDVTASDVDIKAITTAHREVSNIGKEALLSAEPLTEFRNRLNTIKANPQVENAWVTENGLYVKYKKGGIVSWLIKPKEYKPPYLPKRISIQQPAYQPGDDDLVGNNKVCFMNQPYSDESIRDETTKYVNGLYQMFYNQGFEVYKFSGAFLDLDFFDSELSKYGTLFLITHGDYDGYNFWLFTSQEADMAYLTKYKYAQWRNNEVSIGYIEETRQGQQWCIEYIMISNRFIDHEYEAGEFPNSFFYTTACQFLKSDIFAKALVEKGVGAAVGWSEINRIGLYTGAFLMDLMLSGWKLSDAYAKLPAESKLDQGGEGAQLTYYPNSGGDLYLIKEIEISLELPAINIDAPVAGKTYDTRVLTLSGKVTQANKIKYGTLEVNDITTTLETSGLNFSQSIVINEGQNTIKINCITELANNKTAAATKNITVTGNFPKLDLFTELRWNTDYSDVDFHLLPPGADIDKLFSDQDCYYLNLAPAWGATLDVDDKDGNGPEHIEIAQSKQNGIYRLFVHYYDDHGVATSHGPTLAFVSASVRNGTMQQFGPYTLTNSKNGHNSNSSGGDVYEVCTIEYPSGKITPVNKLHFISRSSLQHSAAAISKTK